MARWPTLRSLSLRCGGLLLLFSSTVLAREFTPDDTLSANGWAGGKNCPGSKQGPDQPANSSAGKAQQKTWEEKGPGKPVMVGVMPSQSQIMGALCKGKALGAEVEAGDICPVCEAQRALDISHKECENLGSPSGPLTVEWECKEAGKKFDDDELPVRNKMEAQEAGGDRPKIECEDPEGLKSQTEFCTQNRNLQDKARECKEKILKAWEDAGPELRKILSLSVSRTTTRQELEFNYTEEDLKKARRKLRGLISATKESLAKMAKYPTALVDNLSHSMPPCYREPREEIKKVVEEIDNKIDEGKSALAAADRLFSVASGRDELIHNSYGDAGGVGTYINKTNPRPQSDITGVKEDEAKRNQAKLAAGQKLQPHLSPPTVPKGVSERKASDVTRSAYGTRFDPSGVFSARGALDPEQKPSSAKGVTQPIIGFASLVAGDSSVGAALWKEGGSDLQLTADSGAVRDSSSAKAAAFEEKSSALQVNEGPALPMAAAELSGGIPPVADLIVQPSLSAAVTAIPEKSVAVHHASRSIASAEEDLFHLVSRRYRSTELFRKAKAQTVPLNAFASAIPSNP